MSTESQELIGTFNIETNSASSLTSEFDVANKEAVTSYCRKMITNDINNLTVEFENDTFIYFTNSNTDIRFIEGNTDNYSKLVLKVKERIEGIQALKKDYENSPLSLTQNKIIEEVNSNSAILYSSDNARLASSFLQPLDTFNKFYSNAELFFQPYEAPGGDFYWSKDYQYKHLVVVGDCTGHGTHGAMIAMSAMTLLKQFFKLPPTDILQALIEFHQNFSSLTENEIYGHFDLEIGLLLLDKRKNEAEFAGSGITVYKKDKMKTECYTTKKSHLIQNKTVTNQFSLEKGDQLVLTTDGIADQFDITDQKRLGNKQLFQMLENLPHPLKLSDFEYSFRSFKGSTKGLDDQTLLLLTI